MGLILLSAPDSCGDEGEWRVQQHKFRSGEVADRAKRAGPAGLRECVQGLGGRLRMSGAVPRALCVAPCGEVINGEALTRLSGERGDDGAKPRCGRVRQCAGQGLPGGRVRMGGAGGKEQQRAIHAEVEAGRGEEQCDVLEDGVAGRPSLQQGFEGGRGA
jgi:hypothetical protein